MLTWPAHHGVEANPIPDGWLDSLLRDGWHLGMAGWVGNSSSSRGGLRNPNADFTRRQAGLVNTLLRRYRIPRYVCNAEDPWKYTGPSGSPDDQSDQRYAQSEVFLAELRRLYPTVALAVNTYPIDIDHKAWQLRNARLFVQTHSAIDPYRWAAPWAARWAVGQGWRRSYIRPQIPCFRFPDGKRPWPGVLIASCQEAGTLGLLVYYADGAFDVPEWWQPFSAVIGDMPGAIARRA